MSLPKIPYGLPPIPEGWVYAGMGPLPWLHILSENVNCIGLNDWDPYKGKCSGQSPGEQYIVRIGTPEHTAFLKHHKAERPSLEAPADEVEKPQKLHLHEVGIKSLEVTVDGVLDHQFVAMRDGWIIGRVGLRLESGSVATIRQLYVTPEWRSQGLGASLVRVCINHARARNFEAINLDVSAGNLGVIPFYRKLGFFPAHLWPDGDVVMALQLRPGADRGEDA